MTWDATMLDVADSTANTAAFIRSGNRRGRGAFPKVRLMTLIEVGTHAVIDAVFGGGPPGGRTPPVGEQPATFSAARSG